MPYFRIASYLLLITCTSHLAGHFFLVPQFQLIHNIVNIPQNETERELLRLMNDYHRSVGGSSLSMMDIQNGLSLCYALFFFWLGAFNLLLYKPVRRNHRLLARISFLNSFMLALGTCISVVYFFWLPVASFAACLLMFVLAGLKFSKSRQF